LTASFSSPRGFGFSCQIILQFERLNRGYFFREGATLRKLLIALWRLVREGVVPDGVVLRPTQ
jgi:hypothetical protein